MRTWVAAPIAKNFLLSAIDILDIEKQEETIQREYLYTDKQYAKVPNVIGMEINDAVKELKKFKVEYSGSGEVVNYQSPSAEEYIYEGDTIRLLLGWYGI